MTLQTGGGSVTVDGTAGATLNINVKINNLPASLANVFAPTLAAEGTISGKVTVTGTPAARGVNFETQLVGRGNQPDKNRQGSVRSASKQTANSPTTPSPSIPT